MSPPKTGKTSPTHFQINLGSSPVNKAQVCEWTDLHSEPCDPPPPHPNMLAMNRPQFRVLLPTHPNMLAMNGPVFRVPSPSPQICLQQTDLYSESCHTHIQICLQQTDLYSESCYPHIQICLQWTDLYSESRHPHPKYACNEQTCIQSPVTPIPVR